MLAKELVAVLARHRLLDTPEPHEAGDDGRWESSKQRCLFYFELLEEVRRTARSSAAEGRPFGIMGSSIAACWTMLELGGKVDFFVDEDQNRIDHELLDVPILGPAQVPSGAVIFIPMSVGVAEKIIHRWQNLAVDFRYVATNRPV